MTPHRSQLGPSTTKSWGEHICQYPVEIDRFFLFGFSGNHYSPLFGGLCCVSPVVQVHRFIQMAPGSKVRILVRTKGHYLTTQSRTFGWLGLMFYLHKKSIHYNYHYNQHYPAEQTITLVDWWTVGGCFLCSSLADCLGWLLVPVSLPVVRGPGCQHQ